MSNFDAKSEIDADGEPIISDELIAAACKLLGADPRHSHIASELRESLGNYLMDLSIRPYLGTPKVQRERLRRLRKRLEDSLDAMGLISPEYAVALSTVQDRKNQQYLDGGVFLNARNVMNDLSRAIDRFDRNYEPHKHRPVDVELEEAIRALIEIIERATGQVLQVQMNKHSGKPPVLKSPEAEAIGLLLRGVNPALDEIKIVNMIAKVRKQPRPSESHFGPLFRSDPEFELDCMLRSDIGD